MGNKIKESTLEILKAYFIKNKFKIGNRIPPQRELARLLNVGTRRLREALCVLQRSGFLQTRGRAGTVVASPSIEHLAEPFDWYMGSVDHDWEALIEARTVLESTIIKVVCKKRTAHDLLLLLDPLEKMETKCQKGELFIEEDKKFHMALLQAVHNPFLMTFGELIRLQFSKISKRNYYKSQVDYIARHRAIYNAIEKRDMAKASELMWDHISSWSPTIK